jgi:hypothetical protein
MRKKLSGFDRIYKKARSYFTTQKREFVSGENYQLFFVYFSTILLSSHPGHPPGEITARPVVK